MKLRVGAFIVGAVASAALIHPQSRFELQLRIPLSSTQASAVAQCERVSAGVISRVWAQDHEVPCPMDWWVVSGEGLDEQWTSYFHDRLPESHRSAAQRIHAALLLRGSRELKPGALAILHRDLKGHDTWPRFEDWIWEEARELMSPSWLDDWYVHNWQYIGMDDPETPFRLLRVAYGWTPASPSALGELVAEWKTDSGFAERGWSADKVFSASIGPDTIAASRRVADECDGEDVSSACLMALAEWIEEEQGAPLATGSSPSEIARWRDVVWGENTLKSEVMDDLWGLWSLWTASLPPEDASRMPSLFAEEDLAIPLSASLGFTESNLCGTWWAARVLTGSEAMASEGEVMEGCGPSMTTEALFDGMLAAAESEKPEGEWEVLRAASQETVARGDGQ